MTYNFKSFSIVFQSYQDVVEVAIMKSGCNGTPSIIKKRFPSSAGLESEIARSAGERLPY